MNRRGFLAGSIVGLISLPGALRGLAGHLTPKGGVIDPPPQEMTSGFQIKQYLSKVNADKTSFESALRLADQGPITSQLLMAIEDRMITDGWKEIQPVNDVIIEGWEPTHWQDLDPLTVYPVFTGDRLGDIRIEVPKGSGKTSSVPGLESV